VVRLFLASASVRGRVPTLTELVGDGAKIGVSANALDREPDVERTEWLAKETHALESAGLCPVELELRDYYADPAALVEVLARLDMVWATGGNVFVLRRALQRSRLDELLLAHLRNDLLAYGGCSAGACVCGPTLHGIDLIDDAHAAGEPIFDGLGLVDYSIAPHLGADGEAGKAIRRLVTHFESAGMPYRALRDGQAIVVQNGNSRTIEFY
jgi:dipeptidase E